MFYLRYIKEKDLIHVGGDVCEERIETPICSYISKNYCPNSRGE